MRMSGAKRKLRIVPFGVALPLPVQSATRTLDLECEGLAALRGALQADLQEPFNRAVGILAAARSYALGFAFRFRRRRFGTRIICQAK